MTVTEEDPFSAARAGKVTDNELWDAYLDNLRVALDSIQILLKNIDAEDVVITSDHGELLGEFGQYGHFFGLLHPDLKMVPWVRTSGSDKGTRESAAEPTLKDDANVHEQLENLGYL